MYTNLKVLKKLMKEAYKGTGLVAGLLPGGIDGLPGLYLQNGPWAVWADLQLIPNPLKAFVVELAGRLPRMDEVYMIAKGMTCPETLDADAKARHIAISQQFNELGEASETMPLAYTGLELDLLRTKESRHLFAVSSDLMLLFDSDSIDWNSGEGTPVGPMLSDDGRRVFWLGAYCCLAIQVASYDLTLLQATLSCLDVKGKLLVEHQYEMTQVPGTIDETMDDQPESADDPAGEEYSTDEEADESTDQDDDAD